MMNPRGPPEVEQAGAPVGDPLILPSIDKSSDISDSWVHTNNLVVSAFGDNLRKSASSSSTNNNNNNNTLLCFAVSYMEEQNRSDSRMFPAYEQAAFSLHPASPLSDFEQRVSTLDPNMSSAARYSPTPVVPLVPLPFTNSTVVLQGPPSPLVEPPEPTNAPTNFVASQSCDRSLPQSDTVGGELILMQGGNSELETSNAQLLLAGITGSEFPLTRDFLVMQDDQLNVISGALRNEEIIVESPPTPVKIDDSINPLKEQSEKLDTEVKTVRRSKRRINDKKCDSGCHKTDNECTSTRVCTIADEPVPSRAIATLPGSYLSIEKLSASNIIPGGSSFGVFAKRKIRARTQFGPIEGILWPYYGTSFGNVLPLLYETETGEFMKIDVSNENASNWMRFVRPATTYGEQNLGICQQGEGIVFLTTRNIQPKEELRAGPNAEYAIRRNLPILQPPVKIEPSDTSVWPCFDCKRQFSSSDQLQKHLIVHESSKAHETKSRIKRRKVVSTKKLLKVIDGQTLLYKCPHCPKVFPRIYSLKRHLLIHFEITTQNDENSLHPYNRTRRANKIYNGGAGKKEKENLRGNSGEYKCSDCNLIFEKSNLLTIHSVVHLNKDSTMAADNFDNKCPQCNNQFKTLDELIKHVTQHALAKSRKISTLGSYKCNMCYKRFATKVRLQQHYLVHGAEDQKPLPCNVCSKRFMNNSALSCHLKTHREEKQVFECPMCRKPFNQVLVLKDHIETHRNEDTTFTCPHCPRSFVKYSVIRKHIRAHHCERKHKCQFCGKQFPTVDKLRMHLLRHSDHREFHCANCEKQFKRKDKLKEHMTRMHNAQRVKRDLASHNNQNKKFVPKVNPTDYNRFVYKCHQCLVGFKRRGMLVNHLAKRHPDVAPESVPELNLPILRQTRDYYCQYCDKVYKSSSKRKAHIVKNHPGAALPPSNRQKEADALVGLPNPTFSQTVGSIRTTPQGCQWCHKQYASKAKLLQHQRKKHSSLMAPADQQPRSRTRQFSRQTSETIHEIDNDDFILTAEYINDCGEIENDDFSKPTIIKISAGLDITTINGPLEILGQQFVRMRDIR